ncbi:TIGR03915 family putative DNA repair protein [Taibaiella chishuiensis]|uniref:Putative DNA metabolism protein n=1 Tax=Taibaiella chishuiensis TaxID=1434707 RepID=A0A2P8DDD9_9BACT|nr:TIGR03915 family putative DNA repair protein [Taibaiella chishuiensis]PSK95240.1 putative DNA metabolism protein [Taibaiella chishuiensis]
MTSYIFDGTFYGLLSAVFESYERKHKQVRLYTHTAYSSDMFGGAITVTTNPEKALRVWKGLNGRIDAQHREEFYTSWYADDLKTWQLLFDYALYIFEHPAGADRDYGHALVLGLSQVARKVSRERHRMKAFIRFEKGANQLYHAVIKPDYDVLPLIAEHFRQRYADQAWVIYDEQRHYGLYYDLHQVQEVVFEAVPAAQEHAAIRQEDTLLDSQEALYATLWKDYFRNTNIKERSNLKLHIQHVPKRYWRYLTEKGDVRY